MYWRIMEQASKKIAERRSKWYGHVMRRDEEHILRKVLRMDVPGKRNLDTFACVYRNRQNKPLVSSI